MRIGFRTSIGCFALTIATTSPAPAMCLDDAATFAERVCGELSNRGSSQLITGSGQLSAEAKGIITRMLGSAQGEAKVNEMVSTYENVAREELAQEHANVRDCRSHMIDIAVQQVCKQAADAMPPPGVNVSGSSFNNVGTAISIPKDVPLDVNTTKFNQVGNGIQVKDVPK
jgi:hypothetical protein